MTLPATGRGSMVILVLAIGMSCAGEPADGPPDVRYGESVCAHCNMIVSDERFATASVVDGPRGPEPRVFDDFNCQIDFERDHPDVSVSGRWVHDHGTLAWVPAAAALYVRAATLHTPMASGVAAFAGRPAADAFAGDVGGDVLSFDELWGR